MLCSLVPNKPLSSLSHGLTHKKSCLPSNSSRGTCFKALRPKSTCQPSKQRPYVREVLVEKELTVSRKWFKKNIHFARTVYEKRWRRNKIHKFYASELYFWQWRTNLALFVAFERKLFPSTCIRTTFFAQKRLLLTSDFSAKISIVKRLVFNPLGTIVVLVHKTWCLDQKPSARTGTCSILLAHIVFNSAFAK